MFKYIYIATVSFLAGVGLTILVYQHVKTIPYWADQAGNAYSNIGECFNVARECTYKTGYIIR